MPRIAGIDIPNQKRIIVALTYIYGIGDTLSKKILNEANIDYAKRAKDLTEEELGRIRVVFEKGSFPFEGELRRVVFQNIKRLKDIKAYRGTRHMKNLPARGQKTQKNARTKRGKRFAVGGANPRAAMKT